MSAYYLFYNLILVKTYKVITSKLDRVISGNPVYKVSCITTFFLANSYNYEFTDDTTALLNSSI